jgi:hypothetical protein
MNFFSANVIFYSKKDKTKRKIFMLFCMGDTRAKNICGWLRKRNKKKINIQIKLSNSTKEYIKLKNRIK